MNSQIMRRLTLFLILLSALTACGSQAPAVQTAPPGLLPGTAIGASPTRAPAPTATDTATRTPAPTYTVTITATPCLGLVATPVGTPLPWSYADDYWDKVAVSRIPVQGMECASSEEIMSKLMLQWFEIIKTNAPKCGLEEYTLDAIKILENTITPKYDIVAMVAYHVKVQPGNLQCSLVPTDSFTIEKDGWLGGGMPFGVYRENGYFRLVVLPGWGT